MTAPSTIDHHLEFNAAEPSTAPIAWPRKYDVLGVQVSATSYDEATDLIIQAGKEHLSSAVSLHAVHAIVTARDDPDLLAKVNRFQIVAADGQPVRWALNMLHGLGMRDRVRGSELMLRVCKAAARQHVSIFLYGSTADVLEPLAANLRSWCPGLEIAGIYSPPYRRLTADEEEEIVRLIHQSGAGIVFLGLGCPKQDHFAHDMLGRIHAVLMCVGAAFDFHAGKKRTAPEWMQRVGLEWMHRLCHEPHRLWRRYLTTNTRFLVRFAAELLRRSKRRPCSHVPATARDSR